MPTVAAREVCKALKLGNFYVQRKWNANMASYDYCLGLDPTNAHNFSWWKTNLEDDLFARGNLQLAIAKLPQR